MSFVVRPARFDDLDALYQMAKSAGGGFTNLPADRSALQARLERAVHSFAREDDAPGDDLFLFVLEDTSVGRLCGTCQIFAKVGATWPFYSYRLGSLTQVSTALNRSFRAQTLTLCSDLDGSSELAGLFLHPAQRSAGLGKLLARSRYLFMAMHRQRFADRTVAELRGSHDEAGNSPFWDGVAGRFFGIGFAEADEFNAIHGSQFIADLMPRYPVYTAMLPPAAQAAIGVPHLSGRAAMRMLESEGFVWGDYIDIFDGGPTMTLATDHIATLRMAKGDVVAAIGEAEVPGDLRLAAHGQLAGFRCCLAHLSPIEDGVMIDTAAAELIGAALGSPIVYAPR